MDMTFDDLFGAVLYQLGALDGVAHAVGASVDYVKLHGALYDRTVRDAEQASAVIAAIQAYDPGLPVLGFPGSALLGIAQEAGHPVFAEAFADRAYLPDGTLVPRSQEGALLHDAGQIAERAVRLATKGEVEAVDGTVVRIEPQSLCLHGDTPGLGRDGRRGPRRPGGGRRRTGELSPESALTDARGARTAGAAVPSVRKALSGPESAT